VEAATAQQLSSGSPFSNPILTIFSPDQSRLRDDGDDGQEAVSEGIEAHFCEEKQLWRYHPSIVVKII
jgi:hypothetical protein